MKYMSIGALVIVVAFSAACGVYENEKFSVEFPSGPTFITSKEWETKPLFEGDLQVSRYWEKDYSVLDNIFGKNADLHSYSVWEFEQIEVVPGMDERSILKIGLKGLDRVPSTDMKYITINGRQALDAVYAGSSHTYRSVIFWSAKNKRLYKVEIQSERKEDLSTEEADDFVNSFRLKDLPIN